MLVHKYIGLIPTICLHISDMNHLLIFAAFASPLAFYFNAVRQMRFFGSL